MKLKAISAVVMGLALGTAFAAPATGNSNFTQPTFVQGNSYLPDMSVNLGASGVYFGGLINADFLYTTDHTFTGGVTNFGTTKQSSSLFEISNANVFIGGNYDIAHGVINLGYASSDAWSVYSLQAGLNAGGVRGAAIGLDEAYVNLYDFSRAPVYVRVGKFYNAYGQYNPYAQFPSLTDLIEAVNATGVEAGYIGSFGSDGGTSFFANASAFSGPSSGITAATTGANATTAHNNVANFSANAGLRGSFRNGTVNYSLDGGWLNKADDLYYTPQGTSMSSIYGGDNGFNVHFGMDVSQISANVKWAMISGTASTGAVAASGATVKNPWALSFDAAYKMMVRDRQSSIGITYQMSDNASANNSGSNAAPNGLALPAWRAGVDFGMQLNTYCTAALTYLYSKDYGTGTKGGTDASNNIIGLRMGLEF